jgi:hypothetical protein
VTGNKNLENRLDLQDLCGEPGLPGLTAAAGRYLAESAAVCLASQSHQPGTTLRVEGIVQRELERFMHQQINQLHDEAMRRMDEALAAERRGDEQAARAAFRQAFQLERAAAELLLTLADQPEPSRSVLLRSAASLARDAGPRGESLRLIQLALAGEPPVEIAEELRDLLAAIEQELAPAESEEQRVSQSLLEARRFSDAVGGLDRARRSLEALGRLGS